jgi:hypothetical protein
MKTHGLKWLGLLILLSGGCLMVAPTAFAASDGGYSATCKDGTSWSGSSKRGACRGHKGVKSWNSETGAAAPGDSGKKSTHERKSRSKKSEETSTTTTVGTSGKRSSESARSHESQANVATEATGGPVSASCKDGSSWSGKSKRGACRGHKGVKSWGSVAAAPAAPAAAPVPAAPSRTASPRQRAAEGTAGGAMGSPAPGGGAGKVWVNTPSKTYHCPGTKWYGTTKHGEYMTEAQARAKGYHADHGRTCSN